MVTRRTVCCIALLAITTALVACGGDDGWEETDEASEALQVSSLKIYILAGQSNMVGKGKIKKSGPWRPINTLEWVAEKPQFKFLRNANGWVTLDTVRIAEFSESYTYNGFLTVPSNKQMIGPELGFGHAIKWRNGRNPVLIIKTAWGGKSLYRDFRPPSSSPNKAYKNAGPYYKKMVDLVKKVRSNLSTYYPNLQPKQVQIAGFGWHQGWNDRIDDAAVASYKQNCINLIKDLRANLNAPGMRFVVAGTGQAMAEGHKHAQANAQALYQAQSECARLAGNAAFVGTKDLYYPEMQSPSNQGYHWRNNALSYLNIGRRMANSM